MPAPNRRRWRRLVITLCLLLLAISLVGWALSHREPTWWHEVLRSPETTFAAESIENSTISELTRARPDDGATPAYRSPEWTLTITSDQANAWLATRAKDWVENRAGAWPASVHSVQVAFRPDRLLLGVHLKHEGFDHVLSASATPDLRTDGSLWLKLQGTALGGLPLPSGLILERVQATTGAAASADLRSRLDGQQALLDRAVITLDDGRFVRIVKAEVQQDQLVLTCRTEKN